MCEDEKYSRYVYGNVDDIANIDNMNLYDVYRDILSTSPLDIFVTGDVDSSNIKTLLENSLNLERGAIKSIPKTIIKSQALSLESTWNIWILRRVNLI